MNKLKLIFAFIIILQAGHSFGQEYTLRLEQSISNDSLIIDVIASDKTGSGVDTLGTGNFIMNLDTGVVDITTAVIKKRYSWDQTVNFSLYFPMTLSHNVLQGRLSLNVIQRTLTGNGIPFTSVGNDTIAKIALKIKRSCDTTKLAWRISPLPAPYGAILSWGGNDIKPDMSVAGNYVVTPGMFITSSSNPLLVDTNAAQGCGSLRAAIIFANANPGPDTIRFTSGMIGKIISLSTAAGGPLPAITGLNGNGTFIMGDIDNNGIPDVELNGAGLAAGNDGIMISSSNNTVQGLSIVGFPDIGIQITGPINSGNTIVRNNIGIRLDGTSILGNGGAGVYVSGSDKNTIGTGLVNERNVISGNGGAGIVFQAQADSNTVKGNFIGLRRNGITAAGNVASGIDINNSRGNTIGGTGAFERNVIGSNNQNGVTIQNDAVRNQLINNYIGTDSVGNTSRGNQQGGVFITVGSNNNIIGTGVSGAGNLISGNPQYNIRLAGVDSTYIYGNKIGLAATGLGTLVNNRGIELVGASRNFIGGGSALLGNLIGSNTNEGIYLRSSSNDNTVEGNLIGVRADTLNFVPNSVGIRINGSEGNKIGLGNGTGNVIGGNTSDGIQLENGANRNILYGNYIGVGKGGNSAIPNSGNGVLFDDDARLNIIGDTLPNRMNIIGANSRNGIEFDGDSDTEDNSVIGNYIGIGKDLISKLPNVDDGIRFTDATSDTVRYNIIAYNSKVGIRTANSGTRKHIWQYNSIYSNIADGILQLSSSQQAVPAPRILNLAADTTLSGNAAPGSLVQVFADSADQGQYFLGTVVASGTGSWSLKVDLSGIPATIGTGGIANLTAIQDSAGNSSPFSDPYPICFAPAISGNDTVCSGVLGEAYTIATGVANWSYSGAGGTITSTVLGVNGISVGFTGTGTSLDTLFATYLASPGCTDTFLIRVFARPDTNLSLSGSSICSGDSVSLYFSGTSADSIRWFDNLGFVALSDTLYVKSAGNYSFISYLNGCTDTSRTVNISASPSPIASISAPGGLSACAPDSIKLSASQYPGATYAWYVNGIQSGADVVDDSVRYFKAAGSITVKITSAGCSDSTLVPTAITYLSTGVVADFTYSDTCVGALGGVKFDTATVGAMSFIWTDMDAGVDFELLSGTPTRTFATTGIKSIRLIASLLGTCADTITKNIQIIDAPAKPTFSYISAVDSIKMNWSPLPGVTYSVSADSGTNWINISPGVGTYRFDAFSYPDSVYLVLRAQNSCDTTLSDTFKVFFGCDTNWSGLNAGYCVSSFHSKLYPSSPGGVFTINSLGGQGIEYNATGDFWYFKPSDLSQGTYTVTYTICGKQSSKQVAIFGAPCVTTPVDSTGNTAVVPLPQGLFTDCYGQIYVTSILTNAIYVIDTFGLTTVIAGDTGSPAGSADGSFAFARFNHPVGVVVNPTTGDIFVAESRNHAIRRIQPSLGKSHPNYVTTIAGALGIAGTAEGNLGVSRFASPFGIVLNSDLTKLYVTERGPTTIPSKRIRVIDITTPSYTVSTLVGVVGPSSYANGNASSARFRELGHLSYRDNYLYVSDFGSNTIRRIDATTGFTERWAGRDIQGGSFDGDTSALVNPPFGATMSFPISASVDCNGNVYFADQGAHVIRVVRQKPTTLDVEVFAGQKFFAGYADGPALLSQFQNPVATSVFVKGYVDVAEASNPGRIRRIAIEDWKEGAFTGLDSSYCLNEVLADTLKPQTCSGFYTGPSGMVDLVGSNWVFRPNTPGVHKVVYNYNSGFCQDSLIFFVRVFETPTAAIPDTGFCAGTDVTVSVPDTFQTVRWYDIATNIDVKNSADSFAVFNAAGTYVAELTTVEGCIGYDTFDIAEYPVPDPSITANPGLQGCTGDTILLSVPVQTNVAYRWTPGTVADTLPDFRVYATGNYQVRVIDTLSGCRDSADVTIDIYVPPVVDAGGNDTVCYFPALTHTHTGATATGGSGSYTYAWQEVGGGAGLITSGAATLTPIFTPVGADTSLYVLTVTDQLTNCFVRDTFLLMFRPQPVPGAALLQADTVCPGVNIQLTANAGLIYAWSPASLLNDSTLRQPSTLAPLNVSTDFYLRVTDANGCIAFDTVRQNIYTDTVRFVMNDSAGICPGDSFNLASAFSSAPVGGISPYTYAWFSGGAAIPTAGGLGMSPYSTTSLPYPRVSPNAARTYRLQITDSKGCRHTDSIRVTPFNLPVVNAGPNDSLCYFPGIVHVHTGASATGGSGSYTYAWQEVGGGAGLITSGAATLTPSFTPVGADTSLYVLTVTDQLTNCFVRDTFLLMFRPQPVPGAALLQADTVCPGVNIQLTANAGLIYAWSPAALLNDSTLRQPSTLAPLNVSTDFYLRVTDANGCIAFDTVRQNIYTDTVRFVMNDSAGICPGDSFNLASAFSSAPVGGISPYTYAWFSGGVAIPAAGGLGMSPYSSTSLPYPRVSPNASRTYRLQITDSKGCSHTDSITVTPFNLPVANAGPNDTVCYFPALTHTHTGATATGGSGSYTYAWQEVGGGVGLITSGAATLTPIFTPVGADTSLYVLTVTDQLTNCFVRDTFLMMFRPQPVPGAALLQADTVCPGVNIQLTANAGLTYAWSPALLLNDSTLRQPSTLAPLNVSTDFYLRVTDANGCVALDTVRQNIYTDTVRFVMNDSAGICPGDSFSMASAFSSAPVGGISPYTYAWFSGGAAIPAAGGLGMSPYSTTSLPYPSVSPAASRTYRLQITDSKGCSHTDSIRVTPFNLPVVNAGPNDSLCYFPGIVHIHTGASATGGSGSYTYAWQEVGGGAGLITSGAATLTPSFTPVGADTSLYVLTVTDQLTNCFVRDTFLLMFRPQPIPGAALLQADTVCPGVNIQLTANAGLIYAWSPASLLNDSTLRQPSTLVPLKVSTDFYLRVTDVNGCIAFDTVRQNVVIDTVTFNLTDTLAVCLSDSLSMAGAYVTLPAGGRLPYTIRWYDQLNTLINPGTGGWGMGPYSTSSVTPHPNVSPATGRRYRLEITDGRGCTHKDSVNIKVNTLPVVNAGRDSSVCLGSSLTVTGVTIAAGVGGGALVDTTWSPLTNLNIGNKMAPVYTPTAAGVSQKYFLTVRDNNNCRATDSVTLSSFAVPTVSAVTATTICPGDSSNLDVTHAFTAGPYGYKWTPTAAIVPLSDSTIKSPRAKGFADFTMQVRVTDANRCSDSGTVVVDVQNLNFNLGPDQVRCSGSGSVSVGPLAPGITGGSGAYTYAWVDLAGNPSTNISDASIPNTQVFPTDTTAYVLVVTDGACRTRDTIMIFPVPALPFNITGDTILCPYDSVRIIENSGYAKYEWFVGSVAPANLISGVTGNRLAFVPNQQSDFNPTGGLSTKLSPRLLRITDTLGCTATRSFDLTIGNIPFPDITASNSTICVGESVTLTLSGWTGAVGFATYIWGDNTPSGGGDFITPTAYTVNQAGNYRVTVTSGITPVCLGFDSVTIRASLRPTINVESSVSPVCNPQVRTLAGNDVAGNNGGLITTPGLFSRPVDLAQDGSGNIYVSDSANHNIKRITPGGAVSALAGTTGAPAPGFVNNAVGGNAVRFDRPMGISVLSGNLYVADYGNKRIRQVSLATGATSTLAGTGTSGVTPVDGIGSVATFAGPVDLVTDPSGYVWVCDAGFSAVRRISILPPHTVTTIGIVPPIGATESQAGTFATGYISNPRAIKMAKDGILYVSTGNGEIVKINPFDQTIRIYVPKSAGLPADLTGIAVDDHGNVYTGAANDFKIAYINPADSSASVYAGTVQGQKDTLLSLSTFSEKQGMMLSGDGKTLFITDLHKIRRVPTVRYDSCEVRLCDGESTDLKWRGNNLSNISWGTRVGTTATSLGTSADSLTVTASGRYYVTGTNNSTLCRDTAFITVRVSPALVLNPGTEDTVCFGTNVVLGGAPTVSGGTPFAGGAYRIRWSPGTLVSDSTVANPTYVATLDSVDFTLTVTDSLGCVKTATVKIKVDRPRFSFKDDTTNVCLGVDSTSNMDAYLNPQGVFGGSGKPFLYEWSVNGLTVNNSAGLGAYSDDFPFPKAKPDTSTMYVLTVTDTASGICAYSDSIFVRVDSIPVVYAGADDTLCFVAGGVTVNISNDTAYGCCGGFTYQWQPIATGNISVTNNSAALHPEFTATAADSMEFELTVTSSVTGCFNRDTVAIVVHPLPEPDAVLPFGDTICPGTPGQLDIIFLKHTTPGPGNYQFSWTPTVGLVNPAVQAAQIVGIDTTTIFTVTVTDLNGCIGIDSVLQVVDFPDFAFENSVEICEGDPTDMGTHFVQAPTGGKAPFTYTWFEVGGSPIPPSGDLEFGAYDNSAPYPFASPSTTITYSLRIEDAKGCRGEDTITVVVNENPRFDLGITGNPLDTLFGCLGSDIIFPSNYFDTTQVGTPGYTNILWTEVSGNNEIVAGEGSLAPVFRPANDAVRIYKLSFEDSKGCKSAGDPRDSIAVKAYTLPNTAITHTGVKPGGGCFGADDTLRINPTNLGLGLSITWENVLTGTPLPSFTGLTEVLIDTTGDYRVTVTEDWGGGLTCSNSDSVPVNFINPPTGTVGIIPPLPICSNLPITLSATGITGGDSLYYEWEEKTYFAFDTLIYGFDQFTYLSLFNQINPEVTLTVSNRCDTLNPAIINYTLLQAPKVSVTAQPAETFINRPLVFVDNSLLTTQPTFIKFGDVDNRDDDIPQGSTIEFTYTTAGDKLVYVEAINKINDTLLCRDTATFIVKLIDVKNLFVPNVFSPEANNEENRAVRVYGVNISEADFKFEIFNRWGQLVYSTSRFSEANRVGWDGRDRETGDLQTTGVFTYRLTGKYSDGKSFSQVGTVSLLR